MHKSLTLLHTLTLLYRKVQQRPSSKNPCPNLSGLIWLFISIEDWWWWRWIAGRTYMLREVKLVIKYYTQVSCSFSWGQWRWTKLNVNFLWDSQVGWENKEFSCWKIDLKVLIPNPSTVEYHQHNSNRRTHENRLSHLKEVV